MFETILLLFCAFVGAIIVYISRGLNVADEK